jgi:receptor protein-tyrosine kinase
VSIVERAIRKLQQSHEATVAAARPAAAAPLAAPAQAGVDGAAIGPSTPPFTPSRTIHVDVSLLRRQRLIPPPEEERDMAAQYRHIKRPLISKGIGRGRDRVPRGNSIMVTSALPGEGKTFTTVNLALSMALEQELRVLLVDADVARPRLSHELGIDRDAGLLDALRDEAIDIESLVIGTDLPTLTLLSAGSRSETATELLAGPRMAEIVQRLCDGDRSRIVLFDSPPLLPTTEARVLAQAVGQVALIVRASRTPQQAVFEALHLMGDRTEVSLILTHAERSGAGSYYYGHYSYGNYGENAGTATDVSPERR